MNVTQEIYQNNKKYVCQRCGNCCRWPGVVKLTGDDVDRIASFLGIGAGQFVGEYTEVHPQRICLVLKSRANGECLFLEGRSSCKINPVKPVQCDGFPDRWNFSGWRDVCAAVEVENA